MGTYRIRVGDKTYEYKNVITSAGRLSILNAVAGKSKGFASSIVAGIGNVAATASDNQLYYAVGGNDINATIVDPVNEKIYFKATLPAADNYTIHELGCYSTNYTGAQNSFGGGSVTLATFGGSTAWTDVVGTHSLGTANNRIGKDSIEYTGFSSAKGSLALSHDFNNLVDSSTFDLAYYTVNVSDLIVRFKTDPDNYFELNTWSVSDGYHIEKLEKGDFVATGSPSWAEIRLLEIEATGTTATLSLDSLRYSVPTSSEILDSALLSRVVLDVPQQKVAGISMDVEYVLELNI